jgi:tellurite resistance protein
MRSMGCAAWRARETCFMDAIMATTFTVSGVFGGTVTTERVAMLRRLRKEDRCATDDEIRTRAAAELEATFSTRLAAWQRLAHRGITRSA